MSNGINQEYSQGTIVYYNGQKFKVLSDSNNGFVTVCDESGQTLSIKKEVLQRGSLWAFNSVDPNIVAQYDEKIEECETNKFFAKAYLDFCKKAVEDLFYKFNTRFKFQLNDEQLAQVRKAEEDQYGAIQNYTATKNQLRSTLTSKYIYLT